MQLQRKKQEKQQKQPKKRIEQILVKNDDFTYFQAPLKIKNFNKIKKHPFFPSFHFFAKKISNF